MTYCCSIVRQLIRKDGGHGDYEELALPLLGLWNTVMKVGVVLQALQDIFVRGNVILDGVRSWRYLSWA